MKSLNYKKIFVFDFETTGLSPIKNKVIEVGGVLLEKKNQGYIVTKTMNYLVNPNEPLDPFITKLTGITNEMLMMDGIDESVLFHELHNIIDDDTLLVAYNLAFDIGFLIALYQRHLSRTYIIKNDILDCMAVYKDRYPYPHKLSNAVEHFNLNHGNAHRASDDALVTFKVLECLDEEKSNLDLYVNVLGYNPKYRPPDTSFFKKAITLVPQGMNGNREIERIRSLE